MLAGALLLAAMFPTVHAQPYATGRVDRSFFDADRSRDIPCSIHYPAISAGDEQPIEAGSFPVIVLGHGFVMTVDAYAYLGQFFSTAGYIVVMPTTEGGFLPDHEAFGEDLRFVAAQLTLENLDPLSFFFGHVGNGRALLGHSMGGGAALLGASANADIDAVMVMAPAETSPSAIAAAASVSVPTLLFAASEDCVTPPGSNQQPMYEALDVPCKMLISISGGGHCYFGDENFLCSFGESTCGPDLTITREQQHDVVTDLGALWLDHWLMGNATALAPLLDSLSMSDRITAQSQCISTQVTGRDGPAPPGAMLVEGDQLRLVLPEGSRAVAILNMQGSAVATVRTTDPSIIDVSGLSNGPYLLRWTTEDLERIPVRFVVAH